MDDRTAVLSDAPGGAGILAVADEAPATQGSYCNVISRLDQPEILFPLNVPVQGLQNNCGTLCLAMVLQAFGHHITSEDLDRVYRLWDSFSAPSVLKQAAAAYHVAVQLKNHSTWVDIQSALEKGCLLIVLYQIGYYFHYEVINGYRLDKMGYPQIYLTDLTLGKAIWMDYHAFDLSHWRNLRWGILPTGYSRLMLICSSNGTPITGCDNLPWTNMVITFIHQSLNRIARRWF